MPRFLQSSLGIFAFADAYAKICLAVSKEKLIKENPELKADIEYFAQRAPRGNLKYLEWELKMLQARQARKEEIADVVDLFDRFRRGLDQRDLYQYNSNEFAALRDKLFELKKRQQGQKYQGFSQEEIACGHRIIFDGKYLRAIQIMNKAAYWR